MCLLPPVDASTEEKKKIHRSHETVVVTASGVEERIGDSVSLVSVLESEQMQRSGHLVLDDQLRRVPGFNLFRRSSSLVSHPTTQGVSLRGIGPSGTSRTLVLLGGFPLNDPFGGWIYWNRIPGSALRAVEVVRGATSQLYGSAAMGGTIQLIPQVATPGTLKVQGRLGSLGTSDLEFFGSDVTRSWGYLASARIFDTDGFFLVRPEERGAVDLPAHLQFQTFWGRVFYKDFHLGMNLFSERRGNGTHLQTNRSRMALLEGGLERSDWQWNFHVQSGLLESRFSRILPDRSAEFLTADQSFSSRAIGSFLKWHPRRGLLAGADWRRVSWGQRDQNLAGIFVQQLLTVDPRLDLLLGVRFDAWENRKLQTGVNPRAGLLFRLSDGVTLRSSGYRGFRAPTLNELYRPFRVGNVRTQANPNLTEESLWGGEAGGDWHPTSWFLARINAFWNVLRDPVGNVTLSVSESLILRQRQNVGRTTVQGLETEARIGEGPWRVCGGYLFSRTEVRATGRWLPQVPRHQGSLGMEYEGPAIVYAGARWVGKQFEDDRNELVLGGFAVFDWMIRRPISDRFDLFVGMENVLDRAYAVGRTPVERLGTPRIVHAGIRFRIHR